MPCIFLSYAREDRGAAERLARVVESFGHQVWWDRHLDSGEEFSAEIEAELDKAEVVLVAWSAASIKSRWVRDEAAVGGDTGRLVPVSIDGSMPPMGFRQFHTLDLSGWRGSKRDARTAELLHSIERRLTGKAAEAKDTPPQVRRKAPALRGRWLFGGAVILALAIISGLLLTLGNPFNRSGGASARTIAIAPFTATSSDPAVRDLARQARDSVAHAFSDSGVPIKMIDSVPTDGSRVAADYILSAELSADPTKYLATVRMDDAAQNSTVWTLQVQADRKDAANLPDRVGAQVAGTLAWSGMSKFLEPSNPIFTAKLLQLDIVRDPLQNYENATRLASDFPKSGMAQLSQAMYTTFALDGLPQEQRAQAVAAARQAADRAKSLIPGFGDVYIPSCVLQPGVQLAQCEDSLRAGQRADPDAPFVDEFLSYLLNDVGRKEEALDRVSLSYQHDPYMPAKISQMLKMQEIAGASRDASALYAKGERWWPDWGLDRARLFGMLERGDFDAVRHLVSEPGAEDLAPRRPALDALTDAVRSRSLPQLTRACADSQNSYYQTVGCMLAFGKLGDVDDAYRIADRIYPNRLGRTPAEAEKIWLTDPDGTPLEFITSDAAAPMRRDPRYLQLAQRTGLLAYWRSGRPPDFCRQKPEPICKELLKGK